MIVGGCNPRLLTGWMIDFIRTFDWTLCSSLPNLALATFCGRANRCNQIGGHAFSV